MKKFGTDPKVKKTLLRNYEHRIKSTGKNVIHDLGSSSKVTGQKSAEIDLGQPSLCSSEVLVNYLSDVRKSASSVTVKELTLDKSQVTKKLNFHFNDKIYKNLIELNANVELKSRKDKRPSSSNNIKRDLEPNIEDFYCDEIETDSPPEVPILRPKFKPIRTVENGQLHKLVTKFDNF